jgi:hypothetical protein
MMAVAVKNFDTRANIEDAVGPDRDPAFYIRPAVAIAEHYLSRLLPGGPHRRKPNPLAFLK